MATTTGRFFFVGEQRCLDFVNTEAVQQDVRVDLLGGFDDLAAWSVEAGVIDAARAKELTRRWSGSREAHQAFRQAIELRAMLRGMVEGLARGRRSAPHATIDRVNEILRSRTGALELVRTKDGYETRFHARVSEPADLLVPIAEAAAALLSDADASLVRKCQNPRCILYFYDTTKNHGRRWCSMAACGNRAKVAAHYHRLRDTSSAVMLLLLLLLAPGAAAQERAPENASIRKEDMKADVYFLSDDLTRGRLVGTPEYALTAEFIKSRFERLGLTPAGPNRSFFQSFNLMVATLGRQNTLEIEDAPSSSIHARVGQDFYPHRFSGSGRAQGAVVFAGFGITAPAQSYDDYRDAAAIKGRIVLILDHEPGERDPASPFDGVVTAEPAIPFRKVLAAQEKGAIGVLFVSDVHNHAGVQSFEAAAEAYWPAKPPRIDRFYLADYLERIRIPAAQISPALANTLLRGTNRMLADLARSAETTSGFTAVPLPAALVSMTIEVGRHTVPDRNVVALMEGSDPQLKDEVVIVSAHHDHQGAEGDQVYNGADDNASGTAAVIDIAEAYALAARAGQRPRRSVLFVVFGSEERGPLLGSWAYTERPLRPLDKTVAVLNMDMIGRNMEVPIGGGNRFAGLAVQSAESNANSVNLIGHSRHPALKSLVEQANQPFGLALKMDLDNNASNLLRRSDQWPFLQRGVPAIWFHTGLHPDYHTVYDRPEKINYEKMESIARLVHQVSWSLAQSPPRR